MNLLETFDELNKCYEAVENPAVKELEQQIQEKLDSMNKKVMGQVVEVPVKKRGKETKVTLTLDDTNTEMYELEMGVKSPDGTIFTITSPLINYVDNSELTDLATEIRQLRKDLAVAKAYKSPENFTQIDTHQLDKHTAELRQKETAEKALDRLEASADDIIYTKYNELKMKLTNAELNDLPYTMGWLASHTFSVRASAPYYLVNGLKTRLSRDSSGADTELENNIYEVTRNDCLNAKLRGTRHQYAIALSLKLNKKLIDSEDGFIPHLIEKAEGFHADTLELNNTRLIWEFVEDYGLKFGHTQDVEYMKSVWVKPEDIESFDAGFHAVH